MKCVGGACVVYVRVRCYYVCVAGEWRKGWGEERGGGAFAAVRGVWCNLGFLCPTAGWRHTNLERAGSSPMILPGRSLETGGAEGRM